MRRLALFGPYAEGTAQPGQEIDLLVALHEPSYAEFMRLRTLLERALDHPVDVVVESATHAEVRPMVMTTILDIQGL